jgi:beta-glucosidase
LISTAQGSGTGTWGPAYQKAAALVSQMTLQEKVNLTGGVSAKNGCSGNIPPISRLGFPGLCLSDAGNGLRSADYVSSWPSGLHVGASWNRDLAHSRALGMSGEFRAKGVNMALGPVVSPLGRVALGGRNWEGFSNDPYLCGALAYETIDAFNVNGVTTSTKHYIAYEQETNRNPSGNVSSVSSNVDDVTLHELYLWSVIRSVHLTL